MINCGHCGFVLFPSEPQFCCQAGSKLLPIEDREIPLQFAQFYANYQTLLQASSRVANSHSAIASVGASTGAASRPLGENFDVLRVEGRIFHYPISMNPQQTSHPLLGSAASYLIFDPHSTDIDNNDIAMFGADVWDCIRTFRSLLERHNNVYARLSHIRTRNAQAANDNADPAMLEFPEGRPMGGDLVLIFGSTNIPHRQNRVGNLLFSFGSHFFEATAYPKP